MYWKCLSNLARPIVSHMIKPPLFILEVISCPWKNCVKLTIVTRDVRGKRIEGKRGKKKIISDKGAIFFAAWEFTKLLEDKRIWNSGMKYYTKIPILQSEDLTFWDFFKISIWRQLCSFVWISCQSLKRLNLSKDWEIICIDKKIPHPLGPNRSFFLALWNKDMQSKLGFGRIIFKEKDL